MDSSKSVLAKRRLEAMTKLFKDKQTADKIQFYRVKGSELDVETRKEVEDADVLNAAVKRDDEVRIHLFMFIISLLAICVSSLAYHDSFVIEILEDLRSSAHGWDKVYCSYEDGEEKFIKVLFAPIILHSLVLLWVFTRTVRVRACGIPPRTERPCW